MSGLINLYQSQAHRRSKYWLARSMGYNPAWARTMRDWRLTALERRLGVEVSSSDPAQERFDDEEP